MSSYSLIHCCRCNETFAMKKEFEEHRCIPVHKRKKSIAILAVEVQSDILSIETELGKLRAKVDNFFKTAEEYE